MTKTKLTVTLSITVVVLILLYAGTFLNPGSTSFPDALKPPGAGGLLGTDHFGRSVAKSVAAATGASAIAATVTAIITTVIGGAIGSLGVFSRLAGRVSTTVMVFTLSLPSMLMTFIIAGIIGGGRWTVAVVVMLTHWPVATQLIGPRLNAIWNSDYVKYDRMLGARNWQLVRWHLIPQSLSRVAVSLSIIFPSAVVHEATTAFLGIGVDSSEIALGPLIAWGRLDVAAGAWWTIIVPLAALTILVIPAVISASKVGGRA